MNACQSICEYNILLNESDGNKMRLQCSVDFCQILDVNRYRFIGSLTRSSEKSDKGRTYKYKSKLVVYVRTTQ